MKQMMLFFAILISGSIYAQKDNRYIREGNNRYKDNNFEDAEIEYRRALSENEASEKATYNLGGALYKQDKYEEAGKLYQELASSEDDKENLARYYHNMGNAYFKSNELQKSIDAYKKALINDPTSEDTRYNLVYAKKKLQEQQNQQQQDQNQQEQEQEQEQQEQEQQQQDQQQQEQQEQEQQEQQQEQEQQQQEQEQGQQQPKPAEISEEDARRLLEAIENDEKEVQEKVKKEMAKTKKVKSEKDW
ncbi:MAG: tetratricopeptide repeat protein [Bacteroidota bacterium]